MTRDDIIRTLAALTARWLHAGRVEAARETAHLLDAILRDHPASRQYERPILDSRAQHLAEAIEMAFGPEYQLHSLSKRQQIEALEAWGFFHDATESRFLSRQLRAAIGVMRAAKPGWRGRARDWIYWISHKGEPARSKPRAASPGSGDFDLIEPFTT